MGLAELFVTDDLEIPYDPQAYQDQTDPPPPLPGNYRFQVLGNLVPKKEFGSDKPKIEDGKYPVLQINRVKILEPEEAVREFAVFSEVSTKPVAYRGGVNPTSKLTDFLRSLDSTIQAPTLADRIQAVEEQIALGTPFTAKIDWTVYDTPFATQEFEKLGYTAAGAKAAVDAGNLAKATFQAVHDGARRTQKDCQIIVKGDGTLSLDPKVPSKAENGGMLTMKVKISRYYPSLEADRTPLGPMRLKAKN